MTDTPHTDTLDTDDDGRSVLRMERRWDHPPAKVWRALTEPTELAGWYPQPVAAIDLRVGGTVRFEEGGVATEAVITALEPHRVFAFRVPAGELMANEGDNLLHFALHPDGAGCRLVFTHTFHDRPAAASYAAGWSMCFEGLGAALAGRPVEWPERLVEAHEAYVAAFGLAEGTGSDTSDGWQVRFDRQLMQRTADEVWATLAVDPPRPGAPAPEPFTIPGVSAGPVTAVAAPATLEYEWLAGDRVAGRVRWELSTTPAGARITLTQTGPTDLAADRSTALAAWRAHLERLVMKLR